MMFKNNPGRPLIDTTYPVALAIGSIVKKPWNHRGNIELREILHMTVLINHDVVDGAPAARFIRKLIKKLEEGYGF